MGWLQDVPWGLRRLLNYLSDRYSTGPNKIPIYMTENVSFFNFLVSRISNAHPFRMQGWAALNENDLTVEEASVLYFFLSLQLQHILTISNLPSLLDEIDSVSASAVHRSRPRSALT